MSNYNEETRLPFGVANVNDIPELWEEAYSSGESLTFKAIRADLAVQLQGAENRADLVRRLDYACLCEVAIDGVDIEYPIDSGSDLVDLLESEGGLWDNWGEIQEEEYAVTIDGCECLISWLGGAPIVFVTSGPWKMRCRRCSPCVPGAGDLDSPGFVESGGDWAHCLPPDWHEGAKGHVYAR